MSNVWYDKFLFKNKEKMNLFDGKQIYQNLISLQRSISAAVRK